MKCNEKHQRTLIKVVTWRILVTLSQFMNALIVTGSVAMGIKIAGWSLVINSMLYWLHERAWNWFEWNKRITADNYFFKDGHPRTASKMITWRVIVNFSNFFIPYFATGSWSQAGAFFTITIFVNMTLYYVHERGWNLVRWGKNLQIVEKKVST